MLVKADIKFIDISTFNFPFSFENFFTFGSVGHNDIPFPTLFLFHENFSYLTSIQVMQSIGCMSRETVKGKRFQEILQRYVFSVSLCEMLKVTAKK